MKIDERRKLRKELSIITTHAEIDKYGIAIHLESLQYLRDGLTKLSEILEWITSTGKFSNSLSWAIHYGYYNDVDGIDLTIQFK